VCDDWVERGGGEIEAWRQREKQGGRERADNGGGALHGGTLWWEQVWKGARGCGVTGGRFGSEYSTLAVAGLVPVQLGGSVTLKPKAISACVSW